jgi:hypothetical protein
MNKITGFVKQLKKEDVLTGLFAIYLILGLKIPDPLAKLIDNVYGKIVVVIIAIILFAKTNPILGVLGFLVAFDIIRRSSLETGSSYTLSEKQKMERITSYNQISYTLEQEVVSKMAPLTQASILQSSPSYKPVSDDTYNAISLN